MVLDVPRIDVKETPPGDAPLSSKSVCKSSKSVCACVCVGIEPAESIYSFLKVNVVASPPSSSSALFLLIHPYPGLLKASTLSVGVSTCLLVGTPSFFLLSKKFWHS